MDATFFNIGICEMSADLFVQSVKKGYDSKDFIEKLMSSETAIYLYDKKDTQMWLGSNYIIQTLEQEVLIDKGETYSEDLSSNSPEKKILLFKNFRSNINIIDQANFIFKNIIGNYLKLIMLSIFLKDT